ncbi:MAG: eukaryotic-like serine/threonine-protein kinase [Myxococcales bacterium]|nr:eukaryotic-like serine/threonine-protein kinase [Myxococcales bacterium]
MKDTSPSEVAGIPGSLLAGKYRVEHVLGEGGMGVVVAATNEALRQRVAIKLLRSGALANAKALGRFEREARAAASLRSNHVARVLDVGKLEDGRPYMVMEYLEGRDLGDVIEQSAELPVSEAVDYVLQACEAIAEAHAAGIIHRDLKPKNLFLSRTVDGRPLVKVLDFGISKMDDAAEDMSLTRTTEIIGSPSYMSPEQLRASKGVDVRTDIWAIGVILFELLTKKVPFQAVTVTELVAVVLTEPVPDLTLDRPDVPHALTEAIHRCLAKKREDRFASVADLVRTIAPFGSPDDGDTTVDRVARVAAGSGRSLSPSGITGSGSHPHVLPGTDPKLVPSRNATAPLHPRAGVSSGSSGSSAFAASGAPPPAGPSGLPEAGGDAPPPASSARLNIHGGTSVAWGETQVDRPLTSPPERRRSRWPLVAAGASLVVVLAAASTGALLYTKRAPAAAQPVVATAPPPPASMTLPSGRKDLPPATDGTTPAVVATAVEMPTALPSTRVPTTEGKTRAPEPKAAAARPRVPAAAPGGAGANAAMTAAGAGATAAVPAPPTTQKPADDLSNIGRR